VGLLGCAQEGTSPPVQPIPVEAEAVEVIEPVTTSTEVVVVQQEPLEITPPIYAPVYAQFDPVPGLTAPPIFYPLGWSQDGVFAFMEIRESAGRGGYQVSIRIIDLVQDNVVYNATELDWDNADIVDLVFPEDSDTIARYFARFWSEELTAAKVVTSDRENFNVFSPLPIVFEDVSYFSRFDVIPRVEEDAIQGTIEAYDFWLMGDNNTSKLVYSAEPRAVTVSAAGYFLSPFEPRVAIVLVEERYVFEGNEPFALVTGSNMKVGFESLD